MPRVRLYIRIRRAKGSYAYADPAWNLNRTLRAGYAMVSGEPEPHPEGVYYLRFLSRKKRVWQSVGTESDAALAALRVKEHDLQGSLWDARPRSPLLKRRPTSQSRKARPSI